MFDLSGSLTSSNINFRRKPVTRGLVDVAFGQSANQLVVLTKGSGRLSCHPKLCDVADLLTIDGAWEMHPGIRSHDT